MTVAVDELVELVQSDLVATWMAAAENGIKDSPEGHCLVMAQSVGHALRANPDVVLRALGGENVTDSDRGRMHNYDARFKATWRFPKGGD